jgi:hypothetical protein
MPQIIPAARNNSMPNPMIGNNGGPPLEPQGQMMDELGTAPFFCLQQNFGFNPAAILPPTRHRTAPRLAPLR